MPKKKNKRLTAENKTEEVIEAFSEVGRATPKTAVSPNRTRTTFNKA